MKKIYFLSLFAFLLFSANAFAGKRYWISTTTSNWNTTANWSTTNGGAGGASVPGTSDTIYFTSSKTGQCTLDVNASVKRWEMGSGCGTFSQGTYNLTVGTTGAVLSGGTFSGGSGTITFTGACTISGTAFTSTSAIFTTNSNFTLSSGSFTHNGGTMKFTASCTITASVTLTMDTMEFNPAAHAGYTIAGAGTMNVATLLRYTGSNQIAVSTGTINVQGNINLGNTFSGTSAGGTGTIVINGTGSQYINGNSTKGNSRLPQLTINKSSGTLYLVDVISMQGTNFTYTAGTVAEGSSTIYFAGNKTFSGTITLNNITFGGSTAWTYTISTINAKGYLEIVGSANVTFNTGTINVRGDIIITNTATGGGGTATVVIDGTSSQAMTGSGIAGQGRLPHLTINKSGTLTLNSIISSNGNWTYTAGTVSPGTSTVAFYGSFNLDGQGASSTMSFYRVQISGGTRTLTGNIDCNDNLSILTGTTLSASSYTIYVGGNFLNQGTWTYGTSRVVFDGTGYNRIEQTSGTITFANITFNRTAGKSVTLINKVYVTTNATFTCGRVKTTSTNILEFADNATCTMNNNDSAYVHGPVRKTGNDAFTFPVGDTSLGDVNGYHPLTITAPSTATDQFDVTYYGTGQAYGSTKASTLNAISTAEYWLVDRVTGTSAPTVTISWNAYADNGAFTEMRVAEWNGSQWTDKGQASTSITTPTGTLTASSALSFGADPAPVTFAYAVVNKAYAVLQKSLPTGGYHTTDGYVLYFSFEEEYDDQDDDLTFTVTRLSTDRAVTVLTTPANNPAVYYGNNRYKLDLYDTNNTPLATGYYMLEVTNEKNEKAYLRFKI